MPEYSFESLSPHDFELLVRDLLQAELGCRLETFGPGPDSGVDARYSRGRHKNAVVVQCKHHMRTEWSGFLRALKLELPKVQELDPDRYVVATSLSLTPRRKDQVLEILTPHVAGPGDIFGREDLNNLLGRHPTVERQHFKLWFTSVAMLDRILNAKVYAEQASEIDHVRRRIARFVKNDSVGRALEILDQQHFVVITGVPGIGKSTLAEMLLLDHLNRGFECFRIWESVGEVRPVFSRERRQLFYYDDFLGRTGLRTEDRGHGDDRLLRFLEEAANGEQVRVILTTREYILNQARWVSEGLGAKHLDLAKCVIDLGDYTPRIRAAILYNHLYFSRIAAPHLHALLESKAYRQIVRHPNYSPRIVEYMTDVLNVRDMDADSYPSEFVAALANPARLWEVAVRSHLTVAAQDALLVLTSLPDRASMDDARSAFEPFHAGRISRLNQEGGAYDWNRSLKELDGNFIKTENYGGTIAIQFHNPSVRDFLENWLLVHPQDVKDLLASAVFPEQVDRLWAICKRLETATSMGSAAFLSRYLSLFENDSSLMEFFVFASGERWARTRRDSPVRRLLTMAGLTAGRSESAAVPQISRAQAVVTAYLERDVPGREEVVELMDLVASAGLPGESTDGAFFAFLVSRAFSDLDAPGIALSEFKALVDFVEQYPDHAPPDALTILGETFGEIADDEERAIREETDVNARLNMYEEYSVLAERLGVPVGLDRAEVEPEYAHEPDDDEYGSSFAGRDRSGVGYMSDGQLDGYFSSLKSI